MRLDKKLKCGLRISEIIIGLIVISLCLLGLSYLNGYEKGYLMATEEVYYESK